MINLSFHNNHKLLLATIGLSFLTLSTLIAIVPAHNVQENNPPLSTANKLTDAEIRGKMIYISEGCQACHTQQVRSNAIDQPWGERPSIPADFAGNTRMSFWRNTASVLGSERTGPDLTNIGNRQPGDLWHYLHLYNPRSVVPESIMPAYTWLFQEVNEAKAGQRKIRMPEGFAPSNGNEIITTQRGEDLVTYLISLKQAKVPAYLNVEFDAYEWQKVIGKDAQENAEEVLRLDGAKLYTANCKVCHQDKGQGIPGAFPALAGSEYAEAKDPTLMISAVLFGLDRENEYGVMPSFRHSLSDEEIAAILTFERNNWGNSAPEVTLEQVKEVRTLGKPEDWPL